MEGREEVGARSVKAGTPQGVEALTRARRPMLGPEWGAMPSPMA